VAEYRQTLQNVIEDTGRLQTTVENLLLLARMDAASITGAFQPVDLSRVFFEVFEETQPLAQKRGISLKFERIDAVTVQGDINLLGIALKNLILNAIQYTQKGGSITYRLKAEANRAVFEVSDTGIGIPKNHIDHLFDRFYRVEQSRSRDTGGSGLGLAIAKKVAELHHGKIDVCSAPGRGSTFTVSIPFFHHTLSASPNVREL
jgi:signal transduction histidine kinase